MYHLCFKKLTCITCDLIILNRILIFKDVFYKYSTVKKFQFNFEHQNKKVSDSGKKWIIKTVRSWAVLSSTSSLKQAPHCLEYEPCKSHWECEGFHRGQLYSSPCQTSRNVRSLPPCSLLLGPLTERWTLHGLVGLSQPPVTNFKTIYYHNQRKMYTLHII